MNRDIELLEESIEHWENDIWPLLGEATKIINNVLRFSVSIRGELVDIPCGSTHCPLCEEYLCDFCAGCPIDAMDFTCTIADSPYDMFRESDTLRKARIRCKKMIGTMEVILEKLKIKEAI